MNQQVNALVGMMEQPAAVITHGFNEYSHYSLVQDQLELPTVSNEDAAMATQFSIGENYWSQVHIDDDYYFTTLSVLSTDQQHHGEVIYYFCFPEYGIKIPLKSGEILIFNPLIYHSCSNPKYENSYIFSAYVAKKTVMAGGISKELHKK